MSDELDKLLGQIDDLKNENSEENLYDDDFQRRIIIATCMASFIHFAYELPNDSCFLIYKKANQKRIAIRDIAIDDMDSEINPEDVMFSVYNKKKRRGFVMTPYTVFYRDEDGDIGHYSIDDIDNAGYYKDGWFSDGDFGLYEKGSRHSFTALLNLEDDFNNLANGFTKWFIPGLKLIRQKKYDKLEKMFHDQGLLKKANEIR